MRSTNQIILVLRTNLINSYLKTSTRPFLRVNLKDLLLFSMWMEQPKEKIKARWHFLRSGYLQEKEKARHEIIEPLRKVRKERQPAAHKVIQNEFDRQFTGFKRELLLETAFALGNIFFMLAKHSRAPTIRVPKWFEEGRIEDF